ncbi:septum formation initiator family protein [Paenibacillus sp. R14(2021)]|uniref:FtsB family cell division protein n=1 Tax=Paenibacillus sp. R14(2021) TaxID=2859228 RepID=UPI001C613147|nr:septum formation initiator family protein [Paenibacillus sp. R14(2021)]
MAVAVSGSNQPSAGHTGTKRRLKIWFVLVALFMGWALYTLVAQMNHQGQAEAKLANATQKVNEAAKRTADLDLEVKRLKDPEYIGLKATQELGMVNKGERAIEVVKQP